MTDLSNTPTDPAAAPELDAGQVASMREQWASLGFDIAAFDAAVTGAPEASTMAAPDGEIDILSPLKTPSLTEGQALEMAEALLKAGVPEAEVEAALRADGFSPPEIDTRTDDEKEFDRAFAPAAPSTYRIEYIGRIPADTDPRVLAQFNAEATGWLSEIGFPEQIGPAVIERALDASARLQSMAGPEKELWIREQWADFDRMAGSPERAEELRAQASAALARAGKGFTSSLWNAGALHDAGVLMHLAHQGERVATRTR